MKSFALLKKWSVFFWTDARRDFQNPIHFSFRYLRLFIQCLIYSYIFKGILQQNNFNIGGTSIHFPFFLISGHVMLRISGATLYAFDQTIRDLKQADLLEWFLTTPTNFWELFIPRTLWLCFTALTEVVTFIALAHVLIGIDVAPFLQPAVLWAIGWMLATYAGIGMFLTAIVIVFQLGRNIFQLFFQLSLLLGGVFFPIALLPQPLRFLSEWLPITHTLILTRRVFQGSMSENALSIPSTLWMSTAVFFVVSWIMLEGVLQWAKHQGIFSRPDRV